MDHQSSRYAEPNAAEPNANSYGYGDCYRDSHSHSDSYSHSDCDCHRNSYSHANRHSDSHGNADAYADRNPATYTYAKVHPGTKNSANSYPAPVTGDDEWWNVLSSVKERGSNGALRSTRWLGHMASLAHDLCLRRTVTHRLEDKPIHLTTEHP